MEKIICDICGTAYPETMENCPICGTSRDFTLDTMEEEFLQEAGIIVNKNTEQPKSKKKNKEIFDFDEVNQTKAPARELDDDDFDDDEEEYEERSGINVALVIILVILIVLLLLAAGFLFVRYMLPNMSEQPVQTEAIVTTVPVETEATESTVAGIPCTNLSVPGGKVELGKDGKWLLNVQVHPADTTDELIYSSADEAIVTVDASGTVTAVGEGSTVINITCGSQQIKCNVTVDYALAEETTPEGELPGMEAETTASTEETTAETAAAETTEATVAAGTELKLKKNDISIFSNYTSVKLELDCDIKPEDIKWFTMDSTVAIVHDGVVTSTGSGMTRIIGEYGGQQIECIVRCHF